jgi:hypothetical protein
LPVQSSFISAFLARPTVDSSIIAWPESSTSDGEFVLHADAHPGSSGHGPKSLRLGIVLDCDPEFHVLITAFKSGESLSRAVA